MALPFDDVGLTIDEGADTDYYSFTLDADASVHVLVSFVDADGDIDITLRDATGLQVDGSIGTTDIEELNSTLSAGTYVLEVRTFGSSVNTYDLLIE